MEWRNNKQERQSKVKVSYKRVTVTITGVEKKFVLHNLSVCL